MGERGVAKDSARDLRMGATILFLDESCQQPFPNVRRSWAPAGSRPEMRYREGDRLKLNLRSAVSSDGALFFDIHEESIDGMRVLWFLEQLLEEVEGGLMVIWDNGRIHRSVDVKTFLWEHRKRLETRRFPPYTPGAGPRRTSGERPQVSAVGELVPEDGG